jgi:Predicted acyl-CoA transferases/carnitine dehydratase
VLENYRPGVMKRLGLDYPELAKINPKIVYGAISGYGQTGPAAGRPAYAPVIHASTGYDMAHLFLPAGPPAAGQLRHLRRRLCLGRLCAGRHPGGAHQRHVTGKGQMVDVSMFEALVGMLLGEVNRAQFDFEMPSRPMYGRSRPRTATSCWRRRASAPSRTWRRPPAGATG